MGGLASVPVAQLGATVIRAALQRGRVAPEQVNEVILGNVLQAGGGQNPARQAALQAGLPNSVAALTINKVCGSGLKAVMLAAQAVRAGDADMIVAGGMENMSRAPYLLIGDRAGTQAGKKTLDSVIHDGLSCPFENMHMGEAAEALAGRCGISRAEQDRFSAQSHQRAALAWERRDFANETVPVFVENGLAKTTLHRDETLRPGVTLESLEHFKPAFRQHGTVTAGNACAPADGAAAVVVASTPAVERLGSKPLARIVAYSTSGVAPRDLFQAPVSAVRQVLEKASLNINDIELIELNEAFAVQMLACIKELQVDESMVNVYGGAIALGHPLGASGARVLVTLLSALKQRGLSRGLCSLCLGGGNAVAMLVERL